MGQFRIPLRDGAGPSITISERRTSKTSRHAPLSLQIEVAVSVVSQSRQHRSSRGRRSTDTL